MMDLEELFALPEEELPKPEAVEKPKELYANAMALIRRRRRQLLIHSYLYYRLNTSIVSDFLYDEWAQELIFLQQEWPEESKAVEFYQDFKDFQMGDSFGLPMDEPWVHEQANRLLTYHQGLKK